MLEKMKKGEAQELMNKLLAMSNAKDATLDSIALDSVSFDSVSDKLNTLEEGSEEKYGIGAVNQAILDGILDYQKEHGHLPDASIVAGAVDFAHDILDSAVNNNGVTNTNPEHFTVMEPIIGIRTFIATAIPFAAVIPADKQSGEGSIVIVSHHAGKATGQYKEGDSLNGLSGGDTYISTERTTILETSDQLAYTGKITTVQKDWEHCDPNGAVAPLYPNSTQVFVNGLTVIDGTTGTGSQESATGYVTLDKKYLITAQVNTATGEIEVKSGEALPENTEVSVTGYLHTEHEKFVSPSVTVQGNKYNFHAKWWRADVAVTAEAATQFQNEIGISPVFEGVLAARKQLQSETLLNLLARLNKIGAKVNNKKFDFDWAKQGLNKDSQTIAKELLNTIAETSKEMANKNGSHGVSHIYVGNKLSSILSNLGAEHFEPSGLKPKSDVYRLGRLKALDIEVYYTPKGIKSVEKAERMLLIGANLQDVSKNPVIIGEPTPPFTKPLSETTQVNTSGFRVRGQRIVALSPVPEYQQSAAVIDCINMP